MCYLVRQLPSELPAGETAAPPSLPGVRPRWAGAAGLALVAGVALAAALASPKAGSDRLDSASSGAPAPVATRASQLPATGGIGQTALPMDDGVPTAADSGSGRAAFGPCHHGL